MSGEVWVPLGIRGLKLLGGSPDFKPGSTVFVSYSTTELRLKSGFKSKSYPLDQLQTRAETQQDLERRVTATRLVTLGIFAFAFKKSKQHLHQILTIEINTPTGAIDLVFETDKAAQYAQSLNRKAIQQVQAEPPQVPQGALSSMDKLRELGDLRDTGIITAEEFETKKAELLARL